MKTVTGWQLPDADAYFEPILLERGAFDADRLELALGHVRRFGLAVDVGAHVGFFTRTLVERFDRVVALEPVRSHFECLVANVRERRATLFNCGAWSSVGAAGWFDDPTRPGNTGARYLASNPGGAIPLHPLDALVHGTVDFLKVDVEGAESLVLEGARRVLEEGRPTVMLEVKKGLAARYNRPDGCALDYLRARGYVEVARAGSDRVLVPREILDGRADQHRKEGPPAPDQGE